MLSLNLSYSLSLSRLCVSGLVYQKSIWEREHEILLSYIQITNSFLFLITFFCTYTLLRKKSFIHDRKFLTNRFSFSGNCLRKSNVIVRSLEGSNGNADTYKSTPYQNESTGEDVFQLLIIINAPKVQTQYSKFQTYKYRHITYGSLFQLIQKDKYVFL